MDSIILLFIILFWVINLVAKIAEKSTPPDKETGLAKELPEEFLLFQPKVEPVYVEQQSEQTPKIEIKTAQKTEEQKITTPKEKTADTESATIDAGITLENMLKSTSSLKKAIVLAEILNKPVCLR